MADIVQPRDAGGGNPCWTYDLPPEIARGRVLPEAGAAEWLGVSPALLEHMRASGEGPRFVRLSTRRIGYRLGDLIDYAAERVVDPKGAA